MKWLSAGLIFVNFATIGGLILGMVGGGLSHATASVSLTLGAAGAILAYLTTSDPKPEPKSDVLDSATTATKLSKRAQRRQQRTGAPPAPEPPFFSKYRNLWTWLLAACFIMFAVRSFCWLLYIDSDQLKIQSPNNLGDLALHITYIKTFANGVSLWPDNPIYVASKLRYPAGIDLFNALLNLKHVDLIRSLVWVGLLGSLATFYAFYRWGGTFSVAGFLFNGGLAGFKIFETAKFLDYQGDKTIAWKSIPLAMFVTQRGLLYAIPAGLLLLWHWREKFFRNAGKDRQTGPLPFWIEFSLYASMPLFHAHTFLALSGVLLFLFICSDAKVRWHAGTLVASAFLPATLFVWLISDNFHASSMLKWKPGWVLNDVDLGGSGWFVFWFINFGIFIPFAIVLLVVCGWGVYRSASWWKFELFAAAALATMALCLWRIWEGGLEFSSAFFLTASASLLAWALRRVSKTGFTWNKMLPEEIALLSPAVAVFIAGLLFKFAPWEWDNLKIMVWSYFLVLPFLWAQLIARWSAPLRIGVCIALFASGFVSLFGGLAAGREGFGFIDRAELDAVGAAVSKLPVEARFASYPTYNHPLLLQGRKVVLGYPGHLWTQGFEDYHNVEVRFGQLMQGVPEWREIARHLQVRYIFWGREELINYPKSERPWEKTAALVASGGWGAIYDLGQTR